MFKLLLIISNFMQKLLFHLLPQLFEIILVELLYHKIVQVIY